MNKRQKKKNRTKRAAETLKRCVEHFGADFGEAIARRKDGSIACQARVKARGRKRVKLKLESQVVT